MQNTLPKHVAQAARKRSSKMSFTFDSGIARKSATAKSAKKNARKNFYGNALGVCNGWKSFAFHPLKFRKRTRDGAESANKKDPKRDSAMRQKVASNSKRSTLSGLLSGIRQENGCVGTVSTARSLENGAITIASNVALRNTSRNSRMLLASSLQQATVNTCAATRVSPNINRGNKPKKNRE